MSETFRTELVEENLCTHFILPLLKLNKFSFTSSNFVNCYLTYDGSKVVVHVIDITLVSHKALKHSQYDSTYQTSCGVLLVYTIPLQWYRDVQNFIEGKFSQMRDVAKEMIYRFSGLDKMKYVPGTGSVTDGRLLALDRHPVVKNMWEELLSSDDSRPTGRITLKDEDELLSIPAKESYIDLERLVRI